MNQKTSSAFTSASWIALGIGLLGYFIGLWKANMELDEKGYYFTIIMFGLFGVISLQKSVRDRLEGIQVTQLYYNICWFATLLSIVLLIVGLWNADLILSEKGYYAFSFILAIFGAITIQKNTRDDLAVEKVVETQGKESYSSSTDGEDFLL